MPARLMLGITGKYSSKPTACKAVLTNEIRVSLNIDHVHLVDEATPQPDDVYGIPDKLHHNRTMSRITGSPQAATSNNSSPDGKAPRVEDNLRQNGRTTDDQLLQAGTSIALEELPVATQPAPVVSPEQPDYNARLGRNWAARLERRASKRPVREGRDGRSVHCQCCCSEEEGILVRPRNQFGNHASGRLTCLGTM